MRRPQQSRSEETLRRFLAAAEELLEEGTFDEVSIVEIARRADRSVGAFYARFDGKEALFGELRRRAVKSMATSFSASLDAPEWQELSLDERAHRLVAGIAALYAGRRGVLRALSLRARLRSDRELEEQGPRVNEAIYRLAAELLTDQLDHLEDPERHVRVRLGLSIVAAALREHILFDQIGLSPVGIGQGQLVDELTRCLLSYLRSPTGTDPTTQAI